MVIIQPDILSVEYYDGQKITIIGQAPNANVSLVSAKTTGVVTDRSVQLLQDITTRV